MREQAYKHAVFNPPANDIWSAALIVADVGYNGYALVSFSPTRFSRRFFVPPALPM